MKTLTLSEAQNLMYKNEDLQAVNLRIKNALENPKINSDEYLVKVFKEEKKKNDFKIKANNRILATFPTIIS